MKAKVIKTGEIVDVYHEPQHGQVSNIYKESVLVNGRMWSEEELGFFVKANKAPEKIFICDYGSELGFEWHSESDCEHQGSNDIEYTRTDAFIEKAKNWLYLQLNEINMEGEDMANFLKDFKKYMED